MEQTELKDYLVSLVNRSKNRINKDYDLSKFKFDDFQYANMYLINKAISKEKCLHIIVPEDYDLSRLYLPTFISIISLSFINNFMDYKACPKIGQIIQKDKKRYIISRFINGEIEAYNKKYGRIFLNKKHYERYIVTSSHAQPKGRRQKKGFKKYIHFFNCLNKGNVGNKMPCEFKRKTLIICSTSFKEQLETIKIDNDLLRDCIPVSYVTKGGKSSSHIEIDSMIYHVSDYEVAREYLLEKNDFDLVLVIGSIKYRDYSREIINLIRGEKIINAIFIGCNPIHNFENLKEWSWSKLELKEFYPQEYNEVHIKVISNSMPSHLFPNLKKILSHLDKDESLNIFNEIRDYIISAARIAPSTTESRLINKVSMIKRECLLSLQSYFEDSCSFGQEINKQETLTTLVSYVSLIFDSIGSEKWEKATYKDNNSYLVLPKDHIDELVSIPNRHILKKYSELKTINSKTQKVYFFSIYGMDHYKRIFISNRFMPILVIYGFELSIYNKLKEEYWKNVEHSIYSSNRLFFFKYKYSDKVSKKEIGYKPFIPSLNSVIEYDKQEYGESSHLLCELIFTNDSCILESCKSVLLIASKTYKVVTVDKLKVGDCVRIYDNVNKETLWDLALKNDSNGKLEAINVASKFWKETINKYLEINSIKIDTFYSQLKLNGLKGLKSSSSITRWLDINSETKFPAKSESLLAIKKTINNPEFNKCFNHLLEMKRAYRSYMISLGRDLSNEIISYIQSQKKEKGVILTSLNQEDRDKLVLSNAPERVIKRINYIDNESEK